MSTYCRAAFQKDLSRLEKCAAKNVMRFSDDKWKFLHLTWNNPMHQSRLGTHWISRSFAEKALAS